MFESGSWRPVTEGFVYSSFSLQFYGSLLKKYLVGSGTQSYPS